MREPVTLDDWDMDEPLPREAGLFWPAWFWPLLVWLPLDGWHERFARDLPPIDPAVLARAHLTPGALAWFATAMVAALALAEAGFYGMLWAARGRRLPLVAAAVAVMQAGVLDLVALRVLDLARGTAEPWAALLAGARALSPRDTAAGPLWVAFGSAGALSLGRCALFAGLQSSLVRCRWREAFAQTCGVWVVSHVGLWWLVELFVGRSIFR